MESRRMTVLYIARSAFGVMGEAAITNYVRVASRYHDVHVVQTPAPDETPMEPPSGAHLHTLTVRETKKRRRALFDVMRAVQPDIVHLVQSPYCYDDVMMIRPVVPASAWCLDFRSPHVGDPNAPAIARYHDLQFEVDCLLTHSMESLRTNLPRCKRPAEEIPPGVDMAAIQEAAAGTEPVRLDGNTRKLVYVGSLSRTRKLESLFSAFAEAAQVFTGLTLDIYGQGNAEDELRQLARDLGQKDQITFHGRLDQQDLWARLTQYDAGLAYVPEEMFGTAPSLKSIEYAAVGLPVLASDTEGHRAFATRYGFDFDLFANTADGLVKVLRSKEQAPWTTNRIKRNLSSAQALHWDRIVEDRLLPIYDRLKG